MFASDRGCLGATVGRTGHRYDRDAKGFIHVEDGKDQAELKAAGFVQAGAVSSGSKRAFVCPGCGFEALIRHCPRCDREDLERRDG